MTLKFSAAAALMVLGVSAQSAAVDWDVHGPLEIGVNVPAMGSFLYTFLFEIAPVPYTGSSTAVANNLGGGAVFNIVGGTYSLWSAGGNGAVGVATMSRSAPITRSTGRLATRQIRSR